MCIFQHCKPAVDEETFKKLVERQYELLRKERLKDQEDQKVKSEEKVTTNGNSGESGPVAPSSVNNSDDSQSQPEVRFSF